MGRSPSRPNWTISRCPERTVKNGMLMSPGLNRTSLAETFLIWLAPRTRSNCAGVSTGKIWVFGSSTLGTGQVDIVSFPQKGRTDLTLDERQGRLASCQTPALFHSRIGGGVSWPPRRGYGLGFRRETTR